MNTYTSSEEFLVRSLRSIPLGSQTFSKSYLHYPKGVSPFFIEKGKGSTVWDVDGNEYLDMVNALAAITLGYCDSNVDAEVIRQISKGTIYSLPGKQETYLAEKLISLIPSAEKVRFGKNGSDATSAAVRVARAVTSRDKVAVCGYHGWHDWYIASTPKNLGVPKILNNLTSTFEYNNIESLYALLSESPNEYAAVIMEPMNTVFPVDGFLEEVRDLCTRFGALLIFDETVTGFRLHIGGAQSLFGVIPDLSCFGKGMANGYAISAIVGLDKYMSVLDEVFFSFTYGGDLVGISAANAAIDKMINLKTIDLNIVTGNEIKNGVNRLINENGLSEVVSISGHDSWSFLNFKIDNDKLLYEIKTLFMQEALVNGLISLGTHNLSYAHTGDDVLKLLNIYRSIFPLVKDSLELGSASKYLKCDVLKPLFKVRK